MHIRDGICCKETQKIYPDGSCCILICGEKKHIPARTHVQGDQTLPHADRHPKSVLGFTESNKGGNGYPSLIQYNDPLPLPRVEGYFGMTIRARGIASPGHSVQPTAQTLH